MGGAWHWNTYPGVCVDIPSPSYQFSFEQRDDWSKTYAPGNELKDYAEDCVDRYGLRPRIQLNTEINGAAFDEDADLWELSTSDGRTITARFVVGATGVFSQPKPPDIDGLDTFEGTVMHTARWDHGQDLRGRRVAVIGTGASAVQVIPSIAPEVEQLTVFQRTPIWCLPKSDKPREQWRVEGFPGAGLVRRVASQAFVELTFPLPAHFDGVVPLAKVGERAGPQAPAPAGARPRAAGQAHPRYTLGCKRPGFSNDYLPTFNRSNVELVTDADRGDHAHRRAHRRRHRAPGRHAGPGHRLQGLRPREHAALPGARPRRGEPRAVVGREPLPGLPGSQRAGLPQPVHDPRPLRLQRGQLLHADREPVQAHRSLLRRARRAGATSVEVKPEANRRYFESMLGRRKNQVFFRGSCGTANSYYFDRHGDAPFRASPTIEAAWRSARFDLDDYRFA